MERDHPFHPFPTLETPRLRLRALRMDDLDALYDYASDPQIDRFTPWTRYRSREEAHDDLAQYVAQYVPGKRGVWGIELRDEESLIGIANYGWWQRDDRVGEIGYTIARRSWGQGLATEAAAALVEFGFARMGLVRVQALVMPGNRASERVLEKVGMQCEGLLRAYQLWQGRPQDLNIYAVVRRPSR